MICLTVLDADNKPHSLWVNPDHVVFVRPHGMGTGCTVGLVYGEGWSVLVQENANKVVDRLSGAEYFE